MRRPLRPTRLLVVTGTATEVGKTWVSCSLLRLALARGISVAARKPAQSFEAGSPLSGTDAGQLAAASASSPPSVCPPDRSYPVAMAPPMAAAALGRPAPALADLVSWVEHSWPGGGCDLGLVEGAGGVASPLAADGDTAALARRLGADQVVLVADPALGVINNVRLSVAALAPLPVVVHLNRFEPGDDLQRRNLAWLREQDGLCATTTVEELLDELCGPGST